LTGQASGHGTAGGPMGEAVDQSFSQMPQTDIRALVAYLRSVPALASPDLPGTIATPAPASLKESGATSDTLGKRVFEGACVSCHSWPGVSGAQRHSPPPTTSRKLPVSPLLYLLRIRGMRLPPYVLLLGLWFTGYWRVPPHLLPQLTLSRVKPAIIRT